MRAYRLLDGHTMAYRGEQTLLDVDRQLALTQWIVNTAMVYEFTASPVEARYFSEFERAAFKESFAIPSNFWIWLGRYDGVRPLHAFQQRAPKSSLTPPSLYTLTFTANFLAIQVFAFRSSEGDFNQLARGTKPGRLLLHYPAPNGWISWPPEITIDDEALDVLDTRFSLRSFVSSGRRFSADQLSALPLRFTRRSIAASTGGCAPPRPTVYT